MKNSIKNFLKNFIDKAQAMRTAMSAGRARDFAEMKARRMSKKAKKTKAKYVPGTLGTSAVSQAIIKKYGYVATRRERREMSKFQPFYNNK